MCLSRQASWAACQARGVREMEVGAGPTWSRAGEKADTASQPEAPRFVGLQGWGLPRNTTGHRPPSAVAVPGKNTKAAHE